MNRLEVREKVLCCTNCDLHKVGNGPVPFSGPSPAPYAILGEAPGREEDEQGAPFLGASGKLLRSTLEDVGLDPAQAFIFNSASCYPRGTPRPSHLLACKENFTAQLRLSDAPYILALGSVALGSFVSGMSISIVRGQLFQVGTKRIMATFHPAYTFRSKDFKVAMIEDITTFAKVIEAGEHWPPLITVKCAACGIKEDDAGEAGYFNEMGFFYCENCWKPQLAHKVAMVQKEFPGAEVVEQGAKIERSLSPLVRTADPPSAHLAAALVDKDVDGCMQRVVELMQAVWPEWIGGKLLETKETGGDQGLRRLRQARQENRIDYETRPAKGGGTWEYRMKPPDTSEPQGNLL